MQPRSFDRLFRYDDWANREALRSLAAISEGPPAKSLRLLGHVVGAEWLWRSRLEGRKSAWAVWPELSLEQCAAEIETLGETWREYVAGLSAGDLERRASYVNSKGEPWTNRVDDILTHVVMHSAYHRGQIAADVRASGHEPAYTDFIHAARRGLIQLEGDEE
jgi:uncharacterized damage-inducible protein DinB